MNSIRIVIPGLAVPGSNKRTRRYADKATGEWRTMAYNPTHVQKWMTYCKEIAGDAMGEHPPLDAGGDGQKRTPLAMMVQVYLPIPKSFSGKQQLRALRGELRPIVRPDLTNYVKALEDSLLNVVFYDDASIVEQHLTKMYSDKPQVVVLVSRIEPDPDFREVPQGGLFKRPEI